MTQQQINDLITDLVEVRREITKVNQAAGRVIFNPAATMAIDEWLETLDEELT
jgi:hypothetical protein